MGNVSRSLLVKLNNDDHIELLKYQGVIVACSGGVDSMVLARDLYEICKYQKKLSFAICHVNYQLRGTESEEDEEFVKGFCLEKGLTFKLYKVQQKKGANGKSVQEWARDVRMDIFSELAKEGWAIALGHHENDLAENIIFRMIRGCFAENMGGMKRWSGHLFRPLLESSRNDIKAHAARHNVHYRQDSSNDKLDYSRNIIRHSIIPQLEKISNGATKRIVLMAKESSETNEAFKRLLSKNKFYSPKCHSTLKAYLESKVGRSITMSKNEWMGVYGWYNSKSKKSSYRCSKGTIYLKNGQPVFTFDFGLNVKEIAKSKIGKIDSFFLHPGCSIKVALKNDKNSDIDFNSADDLREPKLIKLFSYTNRKAHLKPAELSWVEKQLNQVLRLETIEKEKSYLLKIDDELSSFFWHDDLSVFGKSQRDRSIEINKVQIRLGTALSYGF